MIGVLLCGGLGTRSGYYTHRVTNKHLIYTYNRAMIDYPLLSLVEAGVKDAVVVTGGRHSGDMMNYCGDGKEFGFNAIHYGRQYGEGGIGDALKCARPFAQGKPVCVILGDNLFEDDLSEFVTTYNGGCKILLKEVDDPRAYGVASLDGHQEYVTKVVEKPSNPETNLAVVGAYIFDKDVFDILDTLKPSARGEYEVTDIIEAYLAKGPGAVDYTKLKGYWIDMGSPDNLLEAANFIEANKEAFDRRFQKHFKIDLSLPLSRSKALDILGAIEKEYGPNTEYVKNFIKQHIKLLEKWGK